MSSPNPSRLRRPALRLVHLRWTNAKRRILGGGLLLRMAGALLVPAMLVAMAWALDHLASSVVARGADSDLLLREHVFWLSAIPVLIWSYTTFEVVFRSRDALYLNTLPIRGATRSVDITLRTYVMHLPLALPGLIYGIALLRVGGGQQGVYAVVVTALTFVATIPAATAIHLAAGRSLLRDATALRKMLAGPVIASDDAMLLWSPAAGLVVGLVVVVVNELLLFHGMLAGRPDLVAGPYLISAVVAAWGLRSSHQSIVDSFHGIIARFAQAEIPPPYTEDGVPERTRGEGLVSLLPTTAQPYFLRDRRQLRRRYRIDTAVLLLFTAVAGRLALGDHASSVDRAAPLLIALTAVVGLFLVSAFRTRGELAASYLDASLPTDPAAQRLGRLAATALEPLLCVAVAGVVTALTGDAAAVGMVLAGGVLVSALLLLGSEMIAARTGALRVVWAATTWRLVIIAVVAAATGMTSGQGST